MKTDNTKLYATKYLIYNRKSTDDAQNQKNSLSYQRSRNAAYAHQERLAVAPVTIAGFCIDGVIDESHSGYKEEEEFRIGSAGSVQYRILRPKFAQLVEMLKEHRIKGVIFLCWDRASRNAHDDLLIRKLMKLGCDIRFTDATYDKTSAGELHMNIDGMFAAHYSRVIGEKVRSAYERLRAEGRCLYPAPIGYLDRGSDNKPLDHERAPVVKRIFELYASGDWSFSQLAKWAREQGLTHRPSRRKRTRDEILNNVDPRTVPKLARPVGKKTIENILKNPFYIRKVVIGKDDEGRDILADSKAHPALISTSLFLSVQQTLRKRNRSVHYVDKPFFTYRGVPHCICGRLYTPYEQKGATYYRSRCKVGCTNPDPNLTEGDINSVIQAVMDQVALTSEELAEIQSSADSDLRGISEHRDRRFQSLHAQQRKLVADLTYLTENRITMMRMGMMGPQAIKEDEERLKISLDQVTQQIQVYSESVQEMLKFVISFSELVKNASLHFKYALDSEKREIVVEMFSELIFRDRELVKYSVRDGYDALLKRKEHSGSPDYLFSELYNMYPRVMLSMHRLGRFPYLGTRIR
jgi:site-specific DNA recombinase